MSITTWLRDRKTRKAAEKQQRKIIAENEKLDRLMNSAYSLTKVGYTNPSGETMDCDGISTAIFEYCKMKAKELSND